MFQPQASYQFFSLNQLKFCRPNVGHFLQQSLPEFEKKLDLNAVAAYMQYGNVPTPHCIFKNCAKVKPGHYLKINLENKSQQETQYWNVYDYYNQPKLKLSFPEAKIQTKELLKSAFNYRMVADVPVGVFLSGGYDSTTVSSLIQAESTARLKTFTIGARQFVVQLALLMILSFTVISL